MAAPTLLHTRNSRDEFLSVVAGPLIYGTLVGLSLGWSKPLYSVLGLLSIVLGFLVGMEHDEPLEGLYRGLLGGLLYGSAILIAHGLSGVDPKTSLPDPESLQLLITGIGGTLLGCAGASWRRRQGRSGTSKQARQRAS